MQRFSLEKGFRAGAPRTGLTHCDSAMLIRNDSRFTARARLLTDPALWCWEIVDASSGDVVASSWQNEWQAYTSPGEALRHAGPALSEWGGHRPGRLGPRAGRPRSGLGEASG
jgi:hypothetical protein